MTKYVSWTGTGVRVNGSEGKGMRRKGDGENELKWRRMEEGNGTEDNVTKRQGANGLK